MEKQGYSEEYVCLLYGMIDTLIEVVNSLKATIAKLKEQLRTAPVGSDEDHDPNYYGA